jgi:protein phosphatase 1 regulatory subunit 10
MPFRVSPYHIPSKGQTTSSILTASPQNFYNQYVNPGFFVQAPYNAMAYGTPWPSSNPVPLSNYSSLNGATSSSSQQQQQQSPQQQQQPPLQQLQQPQQQSHPSTSQHMMIESVIFTVSPFFF